MSRITAPASKLAHAVGASSRTAGAALLPQYADLLRSGDHLESSRGITTAHRPAPQPSLANRPKPLMQTFYSTAPATPATAPTNLAAAVLPSMSALFASSDADPTAGLRMPLLPDNYSAAHGPTGGDGPVHLPSIIAADPEKVLPAAPLSDVEGINLDTVDLKFAHEAKRPGQPQPPEESAGMIRDLWKGMVEDVLGPARK